jgi:hypothetical protein
MRKKKKKKEKKKKSRSRDACHRRVYNTMRIEELVLEGDARRPQDTRCAADTVAGFKSYPVRTQITGWDSSFNAITGLNGSGKSNILDAICFVLGITNMSQARALFFI